jgi:hypothetical protein
VAGARRKPNRKSAKHKRKLPESAYSLIIPKHEVGQKRKPGTSRLAAQKARKLISQQTAGSSTPGWQPEVVIEELDISTINRLKTRKRPASSTPERGVNPSRHNKIPTSKGTHHTEEGATQPPPPHGEGTHMVRINGAGPHSGEG